MEGPSMSLSARIKRLERQAVRPNSGQEYSPELLAAVKQIIQAASPLPDRLEQPRR